MATPPRKRHPKPVKGPVVGTPTTLVADGRLDSRNAVAGILDRLGFAVFLAGSVAEARTTIEGYPGRLDLLVTGVVLPDGSGSHLARTLRRLGFEPAVLYLASHAHTGGRERERDRRTTEPGEPLLPVPVIESELVGELGALFDLDRGGSGPRSS